MKNYNINIKKSQQLFSEARFLVERNACYSNCYELKNKVELFKSTEGIRLGIGFGYVDAHKFGIYNRHCFFIDLDKGDIIDPTMPCYEFDIYKLNLDYKVFDIITFAEFDEYNVRSLGYCDWRFSKAEYEFLKPFYGIDRTNMEELKKIIDTHKMLLTVGDQDFYNFVFPMFEKDAVIEELREKFFEEERKKANHFGFNTMVLG